MISQLIRSNPSVANLLKRAKSILLDVDVSPSMSPNTQSSILFSFQVLDSKSGRPIQSARFRCLDSDGCDEKAMFGGTTNTAGIGIVYNNAIYSVASRTSVRLEIKEGDKILFDRNVKIRSSGEWKIDQREVRLEFQKTPKTAPPAASGMKRRRVFQIALIGDNKILAEVLPYFRGRTCTRVKRVYTTQSVEKAKKYLPYTMEIAGIDAFPEKGFEDVDAIIGLIDHKKVVKLWERRFSGQGKGPLILRYAGFENRVEALITFIERKPCMPLDLESLNPNGK